MFSFWRESKQAKRSGNQPRKQSSRSTVSLAVERLEGRVMLSPVIDFNQVSGSVWIHGTPQKDRALVRMINGGTKVRVRVKSGTDAPVVKDFKASAVKYLFFSGSDGNDRFVNKTSLRAVAWGGSGNDKLYGGNGRDILSGGGGNDVITGGNHADSLYGGAGHDVLIGGRGNDYLHGGQGADSLFGGKGNDRLQGSSGNDVLLGGYLSLQGATGFDGHDTLEGGSGDDALAGGSGHDTLKGGSGLDSLHGGSGHDWLEGGHDGLQDYLNGGSGKDTFVRYWVWKGDILLNTEPENVADFGNGADSFYTVNIGS